jgi:hypothetical protein
MSYSGSLVLLNAYHTGATEMEREQFNALYHLKLGTNGVAVWHSGSGSGAPVHLATQTKLWTDGHNAQNI